MLSAEARLPMALLLQMKHLQRSLLAARSRALCLWLPMYFSVYVTGSGPWLPGQLTTCSCGSTLPMVRSTWMKTYNGVASGF